MKQPSFLLAFVAFLFILTACGGGGGDSAVPPPGGTTPDPVVELPLDSPSTEKVWTLAEILSEPRSGPGTLQARCGGELGFKRCVCAEEVPSYVRYRPAVAECNGNAAVLLSDRLVDVFSIVVRDSQNRDRWPEAGSGFGGCNFSLANSESPPANCSAFKVQSRFKIAGDTVEVHCFGASGYSDIFADAVRLTAKLSDDPFSNDDDIERFCLKGPDVPLN